MGSAMPFAQPVTPRVDFTTGIGTVFWRPDLATGIREIDLQHEELLANVAALREAARTGNLGLAEGVLAYLERYVAEHFATEERVMWGAGYPELDAHWSLHLSFATELARRKGEYGASHSRATLLVDLARWMDRWLEEHLLGADAEMARFVRGQAGGLLATPDQRRDDP
jgi:hemerythrin